MMPPVFVISAAITTASTAEAQLPVCSQPEPDRPVYSLCLPGGRFAVARILAGLAIDQTVRGDSAPITREARAIFRSIASQATQDDNAALDEYLDRLAPIRMTRLDTATGMLRLDVGEDERDFGSKIVIGETATELALTLPERIEGGYWRTPGVFQVAFWKGQRVRVRAAVPGAEQLDVEIECAVISGDGVRLVTSGDEVPDVLVRFDGCQ